MLRQAHPPPLAPCRGGSLARAHLKNATVGRTPSSGVLLYWADCSCKRRNMPISRFPLPFELRAPGARLLPEVLECQMVEGEEWWGALPQLKFTSQLPACLLYALGLRILYFFIQKEGQERRILG